MNHFNVDWNWVKGVVVYSLVVLSISSAIVIYSSKTIYLKYIGRVPDWFRWVLVLPTAFILGQIFETASQIIFGFIEIALNHELTIKPGFECLTWQGFSPIYFTIGGTKMAPSKKIWVLGFLASFKVFVAAINIKTIITFINNGGEWTGLDPILGSPLWWNLQVYILCIMLLIIIGGISLYETKYNRGQKLLINSNI